MKLINEKLLAEFRRKPACELCLEPTPQGCDPHHVYSRGAGRVDVRANISGLCRRCHQLVEADVEAKAKLIRIVATREGRIASDIFFEVCAIRADQSVKVKVIS